MKRAGRSPAPLDTRRLRTRAQRALAVGAPTVSVKPEHLLLLLDAPMRPRPSLEYWVPLDCATGLPRLLTRTEVFPRGRVFPGTAGEEDGA